MYITHMHFSLHDSYENILFNKTDLQIHMTYNLIKLHLRNNNIQNVLITLFPRSINTRNNYCNHDLRFSLWKYLHKNFLKKYIILPWFYFIKSFFDAHMCIVYSGTINFIFHTFFFLPPKSSTELPWSLWYISLFILFSYLLSDPPS